VFFFFLNFNEYLLTFVVIPTGSKKLIHNEWKITSVGRLV